MYIDHKDLDVWKESRKLVKLIYKATMRFPIEEKFGLCLQLRKSAISIPSNIAESNGRNHKNDKIQFLYIAKGSVLELETQIILSFDIGYISDNEMAELLKQIESVRKLLIGYIKKKEQ